MPVEQAVTNVRGALDNAWQGRTSQWSYSDTSRISREPCSDSYTGTGPWPAPAPPRQRANQERAATLYTT